MLNPGTTLHHYTSTEAFTSICQNLTLWATKLGYFSDGGELEYGLSYATRLLDSRRQEAGSETTAASFERLRVELEAYRGANIFVCSFTKHGDQLGQWRGYGSFGRAYSIAFAADRLTTRKGSSSLAWTLEECIYDPGEQYRTVSAIIDRFIEHPEGAVSQNGCAYELVHVAARLKHPSFEAEAEVRLISNLMTEGAGIPIRYRPGKYTMVPYVQIKLPANAIVSVTVGPTSQLPLSISATAGYLRSIKKPLPVYGTTTTFREW